MSETKKFSLNGIWKYILDRDSVLSLDEVKSKIQKNNLSQVNIPANWFLTEIGDFAGTVWFIKEFYYKKLESDLSVLEFDGVDYFTEVYLNDNYLGKHEGYFQKFFFDVSKVINSGFNLLIAKVSSPREDTEFTWPHRKKLIKGIFNHHDCRPGGWDPKYGQDRNTGGIWNNVSIFSDPYIYFFNVKILPKIFYERNLAIVDFELRYILSELYFKVNLKACIVNQGQTIQELEFSVDKNSHQSSHLIMEIENPELWYPYEIGMPHLYEFQILNEDEIIFKTHFGIREVELRNDVFYINGKRMFLRGTNIIPEQMLSNLTENKIKFLVDSIKEANINIVRVHAHINRHELYEAFDREGILVWQDFALQWTYDDSKEFISNATNQIKDMVREYHHHPSIVFWCCHNEPGDQIKILDEFLYSAVLMEDNTRVVRKLLTMKSIVMKVGTGERKKIIFQLQWVHWSQNLGHKLYQF